MHNETDRFGWWDEGKGVWAWWSNSSTPGATLTLSIPIDVAPLRNSSVATSPAQHAVLGANTSNASAPQGGKLTAGNATSNYSLATDGTIAPLGNDSAAGPSTLDNSRAGTHNDGVAPGLIDPSAAQLPPHSAAEKMPSAIARNVTVALGFLRSGTKSKGMGYATAECVRGCVCSPQELRGTWTRQTTQQYLHAVTVTPHPDCQLRITVSTFARCCIPVVYRNSTLLHA